jgi:F0F1-type ATP synthase assembly protein I
MMKKKKKKKKIPKNRKKKEKKKKIVKKKKKKKKNKKERTFIGSATLDRSHLPSAVKGVLLILLTRRLFVPHGFTPLANVFIFIFIFYFIIVKIMNNFYF